MKSSLRKLRVALHRSDHSKERRQPHPAAHHDELLQATQDMVDMKSCYDSLLSAAAATANSAYEFSEALREMGTCLLEKTALNDDEEIDRVLLMLGKAQFELQKLVDSYRVHVIQTITTPSESLLKELQTVEEMKRQCDDKRDLYKTMLAAQKERGRLKHAKGDNFSSQQLQAAKEDYQEEATLFAFRLKSLKQGQSRSLLTQAARHHAAQLNFFRKGVRSLEVLEPHVKVVSEQHHIDYHFSELEDDDAEDDEEDSDDEDSYDGSDDGELSFDYGQHDRGQDIGSIPRNSVELDREDQMIIPTITPENAQENVDRSQADFLSFIRAPEAISQSAPIFPDKKFDRPEGMKQIRPSSTRKFHTYVLPTPGDVKNSAFTGSGVSVSASQLESKDRSSTPLWHSSPLQPGMHVKDFKDDLPSLTRLPKTQSVLKESNINSGPIRMPPPLSEGLSLPQYNLPNASGIRKNRRQAFSGPLTSKEFSGPLTSKAYSSKPTFSATDSMSVEYQPALSAKPTSIPMPHLSKSQKVSPSTSPPPLSSPRINELHELPRPPVTLAKPTRPTSLIGHSAPLAPRGQEYYATSRPSNASLTASPLPTPPGGMTRSFSIPSSGQRTAKLTVAKLLDNQGKTLQISSPPLMLVSVTNAQSLLVDPESVSPPAKTKGNL